MFNFVTIIGVGLIGGSLGLDIKKKRLAGKIIGYGRSKKNLRVALKRKIIDEAVSDLRRAIKKSDLVLVCVPVRTSEKLLPLIAKWARPGALVMDVGSTKEQIVKKAGRIFPPALHFVGCHPLAGTEQSGAAAAVHQLFKNRVCIITPHTQCQAASLKKARLFWHKMGSRVVIMSPRDHDRVLAGTSHLPHMVSYSLMATLGRQISISAIKQLSGGGLMDTTRIAASPPEMWRDICLDNKRSLLHALGQYQKQVAQLSKWIKAEKSSALLNYFTRVSRLRRQLI